MSSTVLQTPINDRLQNQVAIITGAGGNIGLETSKRFLLEGAKVVLVDIDEKHLLDAKEKLHSNMSETVPVDDFVLYLQADVTSEPDVMRVVAETVKHFGRLDCAFLCAGISYPSISIFETSEDTYDRVMSINCKSGVKHVAAAMRDLNSGGSIILASSIAGLRATPGLSTYSMSKFALRGLCLTAAAELGQYGIRVNTIHPSGVNTPMFLRTWPEEKMKELLTCVPLGRWANVEDVAAVVAFLASNDSQFMTGGALKIDGGVVSS
ncbi:MAG: hypothetical protein M1834_006755 [Cirrosporium novae-zelandiae]|nr:MAG: hypothetical protein M1834_006755 [Cirrosporium novae-zelandiae]